jgi:hypothetical protein
MAEPNPGAPQPEGEPATGEPTGTPSPAPPAALPQPPAAGEPLDPGSDWEKKFKGLQPIHQNLQERHKTLLTEKDTLTAQLAELQSSFDNVRAEFEQSKATWTEKDNELGATRSELADYKLWERKLTRIREKAPHLAQFEKFIIVDLPDELLADPATLTEEQRGSLNAAIDKAIADFESTMSAYVDAQVRSQRAGEVPPSSPGRPDSLSLDQLYDLAEEKAGTDEYAGVMKRINALIEKEAGAKDADGFWRPH